MSKFLFMVAYCDLRISWCVFQQQSANDVFMYMVKRCDSEEIATAFAKAYRLDDIDMRNKDES